jgi:hypothetical protein
MLTPLAAPSDVGNQACATCHRAIYDSYQRTGMALSSGRGDAGFVAGSFTQGGAEYAVSPKQDGGYLLRVTADGASAERTLDYFIGSGHTGRSYATDLDGFLFESPVSYYASNNNTDGKWRISPGYERAQGVELLRPIEPACLNCHASGLQRAPGSVNGYAAVPFAQPGVGCERCHGPGERHIALMHAGRAGAGSGIVNPAKLDAARRDSICRQCHLSGEVRIAKTDAPYRPGEIFSDRVAVFVLKDSALKDSAAAMQVNSHVERLAKSACARASGSRLWCGTCHDPHAEPPEATKAAWYRERCLTCHDRKPCTAPTAQRQARADNCVECHMPRAPVRDVQHAVYTDHSIPRRPVSAGPSGADSGAPGPLELATFEDAPATTREFGLAYAAMALARNDRDAGLKAFEMLRAAQAQGPDDAKTAEQLAQIYDRMRREDEACTLHAKALKLDPAANAARINLGTCAADKGDMREAVRLWTDALARAPGEEPARLNLAVALYRLGERETAIQILGAGLHLDPLWQRGRQMLPEMNLRDR